MSDPGAFDSAQDSADVVDPFKPEKLEEVQGPTYASEKPERELQDSVEDVREITGLDFDSFDDFRVEDLPEDSIAQTRRESYGDTESDYIRTVLAADPELLGLGRELRNHALVHENVHSRHFSGRLYDTLVDRGVSGEDAGRIHSIMDSGDERKLEGGTELITHFLDPENEKVGKSFYPDEMKEVERQLEGESELVEEIKDVKQELLDQYRDIYELDVAEGFYHETGNFAGQEYDALVMGDGAEVYGEEVVQDYLLEEDNYSGDDYEEFAENMYSGEVLDNTPVEAYME